MNRLYDVQIRKDINEFYEYISEHWMQTEHDDKLSDFCKLPNGTNI